MPFHDHRRWAITDVADPEELATMLTEQTWTCCTGYRHAGYLYLNDATSENGAQEYAVIREADGQQIESVTFSWINTKLARIAIDQITTGDLHIDMGRFDLSRIEPAATHKRCRHCA